MQIKTNFASQGIYMPYGVLYLDWAWQYHVKICKFRIIHQTWLVRHLIQSKTFPMFPFCDWLSLTTRGTWRRPMAARSPGIKSDAGGESLSLPPATAGRTLIVNNVNINVSVSIQDYQKPAQCNNKEQTIPNPSQLMSVILVKRNISTSRKTLIHYWI